MRTRDYVFGKRGLAMLLQIGFVVLAVLAVMFVYELFNIDRRLVALEKPEPPDVDTAKASGPVPMKPTPVCRTSGLNNFNIGRTTFTARGFEDPPVPCTPVADWEYAAGHAPQSPRICWEDWWLIERLTDDGVSWELSLWRARENKLVAKRLIPLRVIQAARAEVLEPERATMRAHAYTLTNEKKETEPCPKDHRRES